MADLKSLRDHMNAAKLAAYIIPTEDAHQSEYIADCDKRRQFISGFTGSAGTAVVTADKALLWTDGRYHLQAEAQLDHSWTLMKAGLPNTPTLEEWLAKELTAEDHVGIDPSLVSAELFEKYDKALSKATIAIVAISENLVDKAWINRPQRPLNPTMIHPLQYSGKSWVDKVKEVRVTMEKEEAIAVVVTALDEVAWVLNLRGSDVTYNPVFFAYVIITMDDVRLFIDQSKLDHASKDHLMLGKEGGVKVYNYNEVIIHVTNLTNQNAAGKIWISKKSSYSILQVVPQNRLFTKLTPIALMKAIKNEIEITGMRNAHIRDAVAMCKYFAWLEREVPKGNLTELSAAHQLELYRKELDDFVSLSFDTISSSGPNGAVIHYKPTPETDRSLCIEELYLCDSGAQYRDGTTDITRVMHFGNPTSFQKECHTRVLKGHIALCTAIFPNKTGGHRLDAFARSSLWDAGLDYLHGTGHGVGSFLNVHEGPQGVGPREYPEPLQAGMVISDEPGFYEDGQFGVRIENVVLIKEADTKYHHKGTTFLTMEPVTLVPIQQKMIAFELLTDQELQWLNDYHSLCLDTVGPLLEQQGCKEALQWLRKETQLVG
ncbi:xaa-Pro aminopeptidase 1-like [Dysidea avara]|uniref:xaa-Pro aminopeptidase 1-like n=1 Tax=Dysidea avara TaxID=196820 RepID=UPI0033287A2C